MSRGTILFYSFLFYFILFYSFWPILCTGTHVSVLQTLRPCRSVHSSKSIQRHVAAIIKVSAVDSTSFQTASCFIFLGICCSLTKQLEVILAFLPADP